MDRTASTGQSARNLLQTLHNQELPPPRNFQAINRIGPVEIIGQSPQTLAMLDFICKAAATNFHVLLEGESGTGKELMARAIHFTSARASGPFVAVNCGAINPNLIESELFGHEKGAFTGAISRKPGRFERASGGTLFLDEIGELSLHDQVKLLRALQEHRIERVGGIEEIKVDVRIIVATNRNLLDEVGSKRFRPDLYYRLAVMTFTISPLRDRPDDILPLARHFLALHCKSLGRQAPSLTTEAEASLLRYHWPWLFCLQWLERLEALIPSLLKMILLCAIAVGFEAMINPCMGSMLMIVAIRQIAGLRFSSNHLRRSFHPQLVDPGRRKALPRLRRFSASVADFGVLVQLHL